MPEKKPGSPQDLQGGRRPTSHERRSGERWDASYKNGPAPWDIGEPQPAVARLLAEGAFSGAVLDVGCGTGENALLIAALGLSVLGVDVAETALSMARQKAAARGIDATFMACDALHLEALGQSFETVLDFGLFHTLDADERREYVAALASVMRAGAHLHLLCFSDVGPDDCGPHPVSEQDLRMAFAGPGGWRIASLTPDRIYTKLQSGAMPAWLARIERA